MYWCPIVAPHDLCKAASAWRALWNRSTILAQQLPSHSPSDACAALRAHRAAGRQICIQMDLDSTYLAFIGNRARSAECSPLTIQKIWLATSPSLLYGGASSARRSFMSLKDLTTPQFFELADAN